MAGDRAPDAPGRNVKGGPIRLFDVLRGPHFTRLRLFGPGGPINRTGLSSVKCVDVSTEAKENSAAEVYLDAFGNFAAAYGGSNGEYMLIRPDGYVGWTGLNENLPDLDRYLAAVLPRYSFAAGLSHIDGTRKGLCVRSNSTTLSTARPYPQEREAAVFT